MVLQLIIEALKFIFPAYCANAIPVISGGGGYPLDFGKNFFDKKPIFGKNKTFQGFFCGLVTGSAVGLAESMIFGYPILFGLILSLGALLGDLAGAFLKRRLGLVPGDMLPIIDQVDFVVGAVLFSFFIMIPPWELIAVVLVVTPPIHLLTNFVAYKLGLKSNPW